MEPIDDAFPTKHVTARSYSDMHDLLQAQDASEIGEMIRVQGDVRIRMLSLKFEMSEMLFDCDEQFQRGAENDQCTKHRIARTIEFHVSIENVSNGNDSLGEMKK